MQRLALTGSIGMGKSTTAQLFAEEGIPVWDADTAVHRLYGAGGDGVSAIAQIAPEAIRDGAVDRARLRVAVLARPEILKLVEAAIHPLVGADRRRFLAEAEEAGAPAALCDIPLLFETGADAGFDAVVVVSAPAAVQRERVLARPGMTEEALRRVLARQMPDGQKRARATYVIDTSKGVEAARARVLEILADRGLGPAPAA